MKSATSTTTNVLIVIVYVIYGGIWLAFFSFVNSSVTTPPDFVQAVVAWTLAISGTTIPVASYLSAAPEYRNGLTLAACVIAAMGWGMFIFLTFLSVPSTPMRWLFFAAWFTALTGTAIPFAHYLNKRFARAVPPNGVLLRQSIWAGLFGGACAWLQLGRALNWVSFFLVAAALAAIEAFLILRDRSKRPFDDSATPAKR
jgi:hypothetical protein